MRFIYFLSLASPTESKNIRQTLFTQDHTRFNRRRSTLDDVKTLVFRHFQDQYKEHIRKAKIMHHICSTKSCLKCHEAVFAGVEKTHCNVILNLDGCCDNQELKHYF